MIVQNAHSLSGMKNFAHFLYNRDHLAVVEAHSDFQRVFLGDISFNGRSGNAASDCTDDRAHNTSSTAADGAAGYPA